jgi:hypothetical protein
LDLPHIYFGQVWEHITRIENADIKNTDIYLILFFENAVNRYSEIV